MEAFQVCHVAMGSVGDQSLRNDEWKMGVEDRRSMALEGKKYKMRVELVRRISDGTRPSSNG